MKLSQNTDCYEQHNILDERNRLMKIYTHEIVGVLQPDRLLRILTILVAIPLLFAGCQTRMPALKRVERQNETVHYGGMRLIASSMANISERFPALSASQEQMTSDSSYVRDVISNNRDCFSSINLMGFEGELATGNAVVMACAFTGEKYFSEGVTLSGCEINNVIATVNGEFILQNYTRNANDEYDVKVLSSYPFSFTCVGLLEPGEVAEEAGGDLLLGEELGLRSDKFLDMIKQLGPQIAPVTGLGASMQVRTVEVGPKAERFVNELFEGNRRGFAQWLAGEMGAQLAKDIGIPRVPYVENTATRRLAMLTMEDGRASEISLPEPAYYIDIRLDGFSKKKVEENAAEKLWLYGAYAHITIVEAASGRVLWQKSLREGIYKKTATLQTVISHEVAQFYALLKLFQELPTVLENDREIRPVINSCLK